MSYFIMQSNSRNILDLFLHSLILLLLYP